MMAWFLAKFKAKVLEIGRPDTLRVLVNERLENIQQTAIADAAAAAAPAPTAGLLGLFV